MNQLPNLLINDSSEEELKRYLDDNYGLELSIDPVDRKYQLSSAVIKYK